MAHLSTVELLLGVLGVIALVTGLLAVRHPLALRIALRNVRRGRARTALLIAGLLVGTTIISGSLVVGDTVQQLSVHYTYLGAGYTDEAIFSVSATGGYAYFPYSVYTQAASLAGAGPSVEEIAPEIVDSASTVDLATGVPETNLNLIGANGNQTGALGPFVADNGTTLAGPGTGKVFLDDQTATALNASVGDTLRVYGSPGIAVPFVVEAIVQENVRGAYMTAGLSPGDLFVDLAGAQQVENVTNEIDFIAVTNSGSQAQGAAESSSVASYLNATLASLLSAQGLTVHTPLATALSQATQSAQSLLTIFLVLGLFSIVAGALLIIGIFVMLAEERKGEMGMLRAIGLRRRELVYSYLFEGATYAAGSALAGTALGVAVGYFLVYLAGFILSGEGIPANAIVQSFTVTSVSLVAAYVAGFVLTLVTVVIACRRASRLNIVRAIRDIPEPKPPVRTYTFLAYLGALSLIAGALLLDRTARGSSDISYPVLGGALAILGVGLITARFLKNRPVFTGVGIALFVWSGWEPLHAWVLGSGHTGGIFLVFVEGVLMVGGILTALLFNADLVARLTARLLGRRADSNPVVRIGLAYPTRQPTRTAVSLTIFALVVFTMVATGSFGATVQANLDNLVQTQSGGYSFFSYSQTPIPDLPGLIANSSALRPLFANAVPVVNGEVDVNVSGYADNPYRDNLFAAPTGAAPSSNFYDTNRFAFESTLDGMTASQTFAMLGAGGAYAVVDENYEPAAGFTSTTAPTANHPLASVGAVIHLATPHTSRATNVTIIGVLKQSILNGVWVSTATAALLGQTNATFYFLTVNPGVSTVHAAQAAKVAFVGWNLILFDIQALLASSISTTEGFIGLLEIFVGLGLAVGIAAMGILALRAVVERRREIGMLRASGFTQRMVLGSFVLEYSFVTVLGVAIGSLLGVLIVYNLTQSSSAATSGITSFAAPWGTIAEIVVVAYLLVLAAIAGPSIRAARLPPADAVRATE